VIFDRPERKGHGTKVPGSEMARERKGQGASWPGIESARVLLAEKNRLDKFWSDQDILYDYKADLHGIGNRSVVY